MSVTPAGTDAGPGRLTAEWEPQTAVILAWPYPDSDWGMRLSRVEPEFLGFAKAILDRQSLIVLCRSAELRERVRGLLGEHPHSRLRLATPVVAYNDTWVRDYGPLTCQRGGRGELLDFRFDGWGGKYPARDDDRVVERLQALGLFAATPVRRLPWVLEGGSIETDGAGTLLSTYGCLIGASRNQALDAEGIEAMLCDSLGVDRCLWLHHGHLPGDDTDGHIDTLARFCDAETIAHVISEDPEDSTYAPLLAMREELRRLRRLDGRPYRLIELPLPAPVHDAEGQRLPAAYANFLIINQAVLLPIYDDPMDELACERLAAAFPHHQIVALPSRAIVEQFGSLHCLSMQIPASVALSEQAFSPSQ